MASSKLFSSVHLWRLNSNKIFKRYCSGTSSDKPSEVKCEDVKNTPTVESDQDGRKSGLVIGVYEEGDKFELTPVAKEIDEKSGGKIYKYLNE